MKHRFEADVTPAGYGSVLRVDGVELPEIKSFAVTASVDGASLAVEFVPSVRIEGMVEKVRQSGAVCVVTNAEGEPVRVFMTAEEGDAFIRSRPTDESVRLNIYRFVPAEVAE